MPELPEVETARRGLSPHLMGRTVVTAALYTDKLRMEVDPDLGRRLSGFRIDTLQRRGKYLLLRDAGRTLLLHLGMTGHLWLLPAPAPPGPHDRMDLELDSGLVLRFSDPRRFGTILLLTGDPLGHPLLSGLGPEPLENDFDGERLYALCRGRRRPVKTLLMDGRVVAGLGNIYAAEALHRAGIHPATPAHDLDRERCRRLALSIRRVLQEALARGESALPHFVGDRLRPGYFPLQSAVYGRGGQSCTGCGSMLEELRLGGRSTVFCPRCQARQAGDDRCSGGRGSMPDDKRYDLWRQDDNGNRFPVASFQNREAAEAEQRRFASLPHRQIYWVEERDGAQELP